MKQYFFRCFTSYMQKELEKHLREQEEKERARLQDL